MLILLQIQRKEEVEYHIHSFIYPKLSRKEIKEAENGEILDIESSIRYNFYKENFKPWIDLSNRRVYVEVF